MKTRLRKARPQPINNSPVTGCTSAFCSSTAARCRRALISVPYRHQLNFTFDGLIDATNAIERVRTFHRRLTTSSFAAGANPVIQAAAEKAQADYMAALSNDLNTAEARAPIFDLIRAANTDRKR